MSNLKKIVLGVTAGLLILLAATIYLPSAKTMWVRHSGAVIPNGSHSLRYADKPFRILSVKGQRWVDGRLLEASAYHALVIFPAIVPEDGFSSSGGDGFTQTDINKWWIPTGGSSVNSKSFDLAELAIAYNSVWQTVTLDSRTYQLTKGNLFVIRFDRNGQKELNQLNIILNTDADLNEEINAFKAALKNDQTVQQL